MSWVFGKRINAGLVVLLTVLSTQSVSADEDGPVAIVDEASFGAPVSAFDFLRIGQTIQLQRGEWVTIGYIDSCRLETITGGTITVGATQSSVDRGRVEAEHTRCSSDPVRLSPAEVQQGGVAIYRAPGEPEQRVYSATPLIALVDGSRRGTIEINRLDSEEPALLLPVTADVVDLQSLDRTLSPGGTYEVRFGERRRTFSVVVYARPGGPLTSRIIRL